MTCPARSAPYAGREQLGDRTEAICSTAPSRIAMEYSPGNAIPYVSRVDAGTVETVRAVRRRGRLVRRPGSAVRSASGPTRRSRRTSPPSERLYRIKDRAFALIRERMAARHALTEIEVQEAMVGWFREEGLIADTPPNVSAQENAGNPHYQADRAAHRAIRPNELVLIDLWGKLPAAGRGVCRHHVGGLHRHGGPGRDRAPRSRRPGRPRRRRRPGADRGPRRPRAARVRGRSRLPRRDRAGRASARSSSTAPATAWARTSTATACTWTTTRRTTTAGCCRAPGSRLNRASIRTDIGVRTEINMFVGEREARVTGPLQQEIVSLI